MTPQSARVRARVWSDTATIRNIGFVVSLLGLAAFYGGEVQRIRATPARVDKMEVLQSSDHRRISFSACRLADSTINQCLHHYSDEP